MSRLGNRLVRRFRRWLGLGWSAAEFEKRYAAVAGDAWGYHASQTHRGRADRILAVLQGCTPQRLLELGCAEGFLTRRLAAQAAAVVACDLSERAVERARQHCAGLVHVQFLAADVRQRLPEGNFDVCLASDVLYYLSPAEIVSLAGRLRQQMPTGARLIFANEWNESYRDLTPPQQVLQCLTRDGAWHCVSQDLQNSGSGSSHFLALLN
jgi:2-polyprenyl-3-methyl-5-hydroxy-6-metoxy-1,4-benzoquinol methylase